MAMTHRSAQPRLVGIYLCLTALLGLLLCAARPATAQTFQYLTTQAVGTHCIVLASFMPPPGPNPMMTWDITLDGPGYSETHRQVTYGAFANSFNVPNTDTLYNVTVRNVANPSQVYTCRMYSGANDTFYQAAQKDFVSMSFGSDTGNGKGLGGGPWTVAIRLPGASVLTSTKTVYSANVDGTWGFVLDTPALPANTEYEWCLVHGTTVDLSDPAVIAYFNSHHIITTIP